MKAIVKQLDDSYGDWTLLNKTHKRIKDRVLCVCVCGKKQLNVVSALTSGLSRSCKACGQLGRVKLQAETRFGRLVTTGAFRRKIKPNQRYVGVWECRCDCGNSVWVQKNALESGNTKSCGCRKEETKQKFKVMNVQHGEARENRKTPEYNVWISMRQRCNNPKTKAYKNYGGRGISVYPAWNSPNSFLIFFKWLLSNIGRRPSPHHSIDRINNDGNYEPGNIRWATQSQQTQNQYHSPRQRGKDGRWLK